MFGKANGLPIRTRGPAPHAFVIIGAPEAETELPQVGKAYVVLGSAEE